MSKVFVNIGLSLDGYMAPEGMTMENPGYKNWGAKWGALMTWLMNQQYFRENLLKLGPGGETGPVNDPAVFRLVVAFILVCQAAFRKLCCSVDFGVLGLRWTSLIGLQLRAAPDQRLGFAWRAAA